MEPIAKWYIMFNGYGQASRHSTGLGVVAETTRRECSSPNSEIGLFSWREDVAALARRISSSSVAIPEIVVSGFSYGGTTAVKLCAELNRHGIAVRKLFSLDSVWRPRDQWASFWSIFDRWRIHVPPNVRSVRAWSQKVGVLKGHEIAVSDAHTRLEHTTLNVRHVQVDRQLEVQLAIIEEHKKVAALWAV